MKMNPFLLTSTILSTVNLFHDINSVWIVCFSEPNSHRKERRHPAFSFFGCQPMESEEKLKSEVEAQDASVFSCSSVRTF
jgi:hypothetical protein